jgi:transposase-like protein
MDEQRGRLSAKAKFEIYLETRAKDANVGEVLRRYGLHVNDLHKIEAVVEAAAVEALKRRNNGRPGGENEDPEYAELVRELREKERALAELTVEYTLLKKRERSGSSGLSKGPTSAGRVERR